ncbi:C-type mannose receptor 2-like [Pimephales promelas]|uniref:C-type mannose receptor 2-like n=1 Tax=Pimephales promelas TaxID=90988 RepID=UPI00195580AC|nr:C-type mannose receptor 2-like [Pimephales promelas]
MAMLISCLLLFIIFSMGNTEDRCPATWTQYGLRCYKFISHPTNWITAQRNCQSLGANLASVHNKLENKFLLSLLPSPSTRTWIGANDAVQGGHWLWSDGSVFLYTHWCSGEPSIQRPENCLEINFTSDRCWNNEPCSHSLSYICVKDLSDCLADPQFIMPMLKSCLLLFIIFSMGNTEDAVSLSRRCPATWMKFGLRCFKYFSHSATWITAERNCQSLGANLASVRNRLENDFLLSLLPSSTRTWIGGHDAIQEGHWLWSDGSVFLYSHWCTGQPDNLGVENCLEINFTSNRCWNDAFCTTSLSYICVKDL